MCATPPFSQSLRMIVDTGASRTSISTKDARTIGLDYSTLTQDDDSVGIGGHIETYLLKGISLIFEDTRSSYHVERLPTIIAMRGADDAVPSLLGVDVLRKYRVFFDRKGVILER